MRVTSTTKVPNLNADWLDGLNSTHFPRRAVVPFNLAPGEISAPIAIPPGGPVFVMGATASGLQEVGWAILLGTPTSLFWTDTDGPRNTNIAGTRIISIVMGEAIDIEVNDSQSIRIHSNVGTGGVSLAGAVKLIW
jgi:hypothetical protein